MPDVKNELKKKETLLKGHRIHLRKRSEIAKEVLRLKSKNKIKRDSNAIISLNSLHRRSKHRSLDLKRTNSLNKKKEIYKNDKYRLLFAIRNKRSVESSVSSTTLKNMGLSQLGTGRFFSNSDVCLRNLERVRPFVFYGMPTLKHVYDLLHKRGTVVLPSGEKKLMNSNSVVEDIIGGTDILCVADVVETIFKGSDIAEDILTKLGSINLPNSILDGLVSQNIFVTSNTAHYNMVISVII
ncbi:60S ribosomal protein L7-B, putative [Babesia ovis]|uniref:60S ribosomal protein L7-B, putative n=1 Tax=Babesia ovis TaxID=5869 RepID=A0A9W5WV90_BABOV|nr:60S ribosomal protein L7-B, putative [Babesia ovis]